MNSDPIWIFHLLPPSFQIALWIGLSVLIVLAGFGVYIAIFGQRGKEVDLSVYMRKPFLFDSQPEFELFKMLVDLFQDRYFIFPQVHYMHLLKPRKGLENGEFRAALNKIDRKSADFVLCDKDRVVPQLIIELDGPTHDWPERQKRDAFINEITKIADLKILHIKTGGITRDFVKNAVEKALLPPDSQK